jgi:calcium/calmodulin-dependent protein kinase I
MTVSIFDAIDREVNPSLKFWGDPDELSLQDATENKIHESDLLFLMPNGSWKTKKVILTKRRIYCYDKSSSILKKMTTVIWKKLEPFSEENDSEERFGFRLIQRGIYQDFYTKTAEELEGWVDKLSKVVILNDLEDDYAIIKEIGNGNYAKVFLALDIHENKEYAVKSIFKEKIWSSSRSVSALVSEINVMKKLNHPFLVVLHKVYENETYVHLILDYVPGGDLFRRISDRKAFTEESASKFMKNLLEVLDYMHSLNIVHRDLKPENILMMQLDNDYEFKIADFGLACEYTDELSLRCGSPGYVAPEILKKKHYGNKVDIFSAGIIVYVLLSSRAPFYGKTANDILLKNKECKVCFDEKYWKNISKEGIDFVLRMTDSEPEFRPDAKQALRHNWISMNHGMNTSGLLSVPTNEYQTGNSYISRELMDRFNKRRSVPDNFVKLKGEEEKIPEAKKIIMAKGAKNLLMKLREADSALNS